MLRLTLLASIVVLAGCASTPIATQEVDKYHVCKANPNAAYINEKGLKINCADELTLRKSQRPIF